MDPASIDYRQVFEGAPARLAVLQPDPRYTIVAVSDAYLALSGRSRAELVGRGVFEAFPQNPADPLADGAAMLVASLQRVLASGRADTMPVQRYDLQHDHGYQERWWQVTNAPLLDAQGRVGLLLHRVEEATSLVLAQRVEQQERARLVEAVQAFQAIYDQGLFAGRLDLQGVVLDANRSSLEQCGYQRSEVLGRPFWECGWWNRSTAVQDWVRGAVAQAARGDPFRGSSTYFLADGSARLVDFACMPIRAESGEVLFLVPTGMDITERAQGAQELRASDILDSITEGFFSLDHDWRFTYVNPEALRILDRSAAELLGRTLHEAYPGLVGHELERIYRGTMVDREPRSMLSYYPDHERWYEVHTYPAPKGLSVYFRDVTAQHLSAARHAELEAQSERQRRIYEAALSNTPDLVYVFDLQHRFIYANEALLAMWGRSSAEALGRNCLELGYEPWHAAMHDREIEQVVATRQPIRGEVPFTGTHGRRIYDYIFAPVLGADGTVVAVAGTTRDVTERQQAEQALRAQAAQLAESDRAKDEFLATLSHELRNPLAPLRNSLSLLRLAGNDSPGPDAALHAMMERQVEHLVRLVDDLLEMSRISRGTLVLRQERVDLASCVRSALDNSAPLLAAAHHQLQVDLPDAPLWVDGDPVRLVQVLANLLDNAAKYTDDGGQLRVLARREDGMALVEVSDNGCGIEPALLPRMFEMFRRGPGGAGRAQGGLGIGLALARTLAELHGGSLQAHSAGPGQGSSFSLRLPLVAASAAPAAAEPEPALPRQRILLVDDNQDAGDSLGMILRFLGAEVEVVRDGPAALAAFERRPPDVVLLDIGMPGMDGYEVARTLRARHPQHVAVLVALTGWGQENDRRLAREAGFDHHLVKPAEIATLRRLLASLPGASPAS